MFAHRRTRAVGFLEGGKEGQMAKKRIRLLHDSSHPDAAGGVGDVIECDEVIADRFIDGNGAEEVDDGEVTAPTPALARRKPGTRAKQKSDT